MEPSITPKRTILKQATSPENRMAIETAVESPLTTTNAAGPTPGDVIVTDNLWKTYEMGDQQVHPLRGVNLRIPHNEYAAIMGPPASTNPPFMTLTPSLP